MRRRTIVLIALVLLVMIVGVALVILINNAQTLSKVALSEERCREVSEAETCLQFPIVSGLNLDNDEYVLPDDFVGELVFVVMPFSDEQQIIAESWLNPVRELADEYPALTYYNVPIFPDIEAAFRLIIRAGLVVAISEPELRTATITVFLEDREQFLDALKIPNVDAIHSLVLNANGEVLWQADGAYTDESGTALRELVEAYTQAPD